jgi:hypothetical protein
MINRLGLVLECGREGADERVLRCLIARLSSDTEVRVAAMGDKAALFRDGIQAADKLLSADKCDHVFVIWDLHPEWRQDISSAKSCAFECAEMRKQLPGKLADKITPICILRSLEAWILADERALSAYFSRPAHAVKIPRVPSPDRDKDPKGRIFTMFKQQGRRYTDRLDAVRVIQATQNTNRLRRIPSFARLSEKLVGNAAANFQKDGDVCAKLAAQGR